MMPDIGLKNSCGRWHGTDARRFFKISSSTRQLTEARLNRDLTQLSKASMLTGFTRDHQPLLPCSCEELPAPAFRSSVRPAGHEVQDRAGGRAGELNHLRPAYVIAKEQIREALPGHGKNHLLKVALQPAIQVWARFQKVLEVDSGEYKHFSCTVPWLLSSFLLG